MLGSNSLKQAVVKTVRSGISQVRNATGSSGSLCLSEPEVAAAYEAHKAEHPSTSFSKEVLPKAEGISEAEKVNRIVLDRLKFTQVSNAATQGTVNPAQGRQRG